jgi:hypothetical protein
MPRGPLPRQWPPQSAILGRPPSLTGPEPLADVLEREEEQREAVRGALDELTEESA